jgi:hypothetical protein
MEKLEREQLPNITVLEAIDAEAEVLVCLERRVTEDYLANECDDDRDYQHNSR